MPEFDIVAFNTIKDILVDQLPPEVGRAIKQFDKNARSERKIQQINLQNTHLAHQSQQMNTLQNELSMTRSELAQTREALKQTIDDASNRIAEADKKIVDANKKMDELKQEAKKANIWMWVGIAIGVLGIVVSIFIANHQAAVEAAKVTMSISS